MMGALLAWMWFAQAIDLKSTCDKLATGHYVERMTIFPADSCKSVAIQKLTMSGLATAGALVHPGKNEKAGRWMVGIVAGQGTIGFVINVSR